MSAAETFSPPIDFPASFLADIERAVMSRAGRQRNSEILFQCPLDGHEDTHPSARWHTQKQTWFCDVCKIGGGALNLADLLNIERPTRPAGPTIVKPRKIVATYDYFDDVGAFRFQVVRYDPKDFRQRRPNIRDGGWIWNLQGIEPVLYNLQDILVVHPAKAREW